MKKFIPGIIAGISILLVTTNTYAQLVLSKSYVRETLNPGEVVASTISLLNPSDAGVRLKAYWQDFSYTEPFDGTKQFSPAGSTEHTIGDWISYSPQESTIAPRSKEEINYSIKMPDDAKGGHYGVLFFELIPEPGEVPKEKMALSIVTRLGSLFFIDSSDKDKSAKIDQIDVKDKGFSGVFHNMGNVILIPAATYYILNQEGLVEDRGKIKNIYLPPDKEAKFEFALENNLKGGRYTAVLTFDLNEGDTVVKEIDFSRSSSGDISISHIRD